MRSETPTHVRPVTPRTYHTTTYIFDYVSWSIPVPYPNVFVLSTHSYAYIIDQLTSFHFLFWLAPYSWFISNITPGSTSAHPLLSLHRHSSRCSLSTHLSISTPLGSPIIENTCYDFRDEAQKWATLWSGRGGPEMGHPWDIPELGQSCKIAPEATVARSF